MLLSKNKMMKTRDVFFSTWYLICKLVTLERLAQSQTMESVIVNIAKPPFRSVIWVQCVCFPLA